MAIQALSARREREAAEWAERAGRAGLVARGFVYFVVGLLSFMLAAKTPGASPNRRGALEAIVSQPFGRLIVTGLAVGFLAFAAWRVMEALFADKWTKRLANFGRALLYVGFFATAVQFVLHGSNEGKDAGHEVDITARVLGWQGGRWIVMAAGAAIVGAGLWNAYRGLAQRYRKKLKWRDMSKAAERIVPTIATVGLLGRAAAFALVGAFVVNAGIDHNPSDAGGLDAALLHLIEARLGPALVTFVGIGLLAFAAYSVVEARYREIPQT